MAPKRLHSGGFILFLAAFCALMVGVVKLVQAVALHYPHLFVLGMLLAAAAVVAMVILSIKTPMV